MAKELTGTVRRVYRLFGRVRFTVAWSSGETETITVPKGQFDAAIRRGDTIGTIVPDPTHTADDLLRWNAWNPSNGPPPMPIDTTPDMPPEAGRYYRVGGTAAR